MSVAGPIRLRLFFAIWPTAEAAGALHDFAAALSERTGGRVMPAQTIHLTLAFLGAVDFDCIPAAIGAARRVRSHPQRLALARCRYRPRSRIVWAEPGETPARLAALAADLGRALESAGFELEKRAFAAHVTLIRKARAARRLPPPPVVAWPVEEFTLVRSLQSNEGSHYEVLERFALSNSE